MERLSVSRHFTAFRAYNAEIRPYFAVDDGQPIPHMRKLIEPLNVTFPENARPYCSSFSITFYDHTGNKVLGEVNKHDLCGASPYLLHVEGKWWEIQGSGMVQFFEGEWVVERTLSRATRLAKWLNGELESNVAQ